MYDIICEQLFVLSVVFDRNGRIRPERRFWSRPVSDS